MSKKHHEEEHAGNHERWLLTYSDMITLLMIFFIVMYSMSSVNQQKFNALANAMGIAMGAGPVFVEQAPIGGESVLDAIKAGEEAEKAMDKTEKEISKYIEENNLGNVINIYRDERGLVISMNETLLFELGSADIGAKAVEPLKHIGKMLSGLPNYIAVEGFTDNLPIKTAKFPSNWELASQRAINVAKAIILDGVNPERISTKSYGEYRPAYANTTPENRKLNRRVDIIMLKAEFNKLEPGMKNEEAGSANTPTADTPGTSAPASTSAGH